MRTRGPKRLSDEERERRTAARRQAGDELRAIRQAAGLTQAEVATALDCTRQAVAAWEAGDVAVPADARAYVVGRLKDSDNRQQTQK